MVAWTYDKMRKDMRGEQMDEYIFCKAEVKNVPDERMDHGFMVVRAVDGEFWYYGVYSVKESAEEACKEIGNGVILEV